MPKGPGQFVAFLSSAYGIFVSERMALHHLGGGSVVWVVEGQHPELGHINDKSPPEDKRLLNRVCLAGVRQCEVLIWVVSPRDGIQKITDGFMVSLREAEVVQAVLHMMPIHVVRVVPDDPGQQWEPSVTGLVDLLCSTYPRISTDVSCTRAELIPHLIGLVQRHSRIQGIERRLHTFRRYARKLSRSGATQFVLPPPVAVARVDLDSVELILQDAADVRNDYAYRLALLWVAIRSLQSWLTDNATPQARAAGLLVGAMRGWQSAAAWYGLHRHFGWGRLEALNALREHGESIPGGEASLHYSLASSGPLCGRPAALRRVDVALQAARRTTSADATGILLITAHHNAKPRVRIVPVPSVHWHPRIALRLVRRVLLERTKRREPEHRIGEAMVDHGWILCLNGQPRRGLREALAGYEAMKRGRAEPGFLVQKRRVIGLCHFAAGRLLSAIREWNTAHRDAVEWCAFDQIRWYTMVARYMPFSNGG